MDTDSDVDVALYSSIEIIVVGDGDALAAGSRRHLPSEVSGEPPWREIRSTTSESTHGSREASKRCDVPGSKHPKRDGCVRRLGASEGAGQAGGGKVIAGVKRRARATLRARFSREEGRVWPLIYTITC